MSSSTDDADAEELRTLDVYIDEILPDQHQDVVSRQVGDLIRALHEALLDDEKRRLLSGVSPESPEYLQAYTHLVRKAQQLGISPGKIATL